MLQIVNHHSRRTIFLPYLKKKIKLVLSYLGLETCTLELTLVADKFMIEQNQKHRGKRGTTDVLSFPQIQPKAVNSRDFGHFRSGFLGDILISLDQAQKQADEQNIDLEREVLFLTVHSILHLLGFDHETEKQRVEMQSLESEIWQHVINEL